MGYHSYYRHMAEWSGQTSLSGWFGTGPSGSDLAHDTIPIHGARLKATYIEDQQLERLKNAKHLILTFDGTLRESYIRP